MWEDEGLNEINKKVFDEPNSTWEAIIGYPGWVSPSVNQLVYLFLSLSNTTCTSAQPARILLYPGRVLRRGMSWSHKKLSGLKGLAFHVRKWRPKMMKWFYVIELFYGKDEAGIWVLNFKFSALPFNKYSHPLFLPTHSSIHTSIHPSDHLSIHPTILS